MWTTEGLEYLFNGQPVDPRCGCGHELGRHYHFTPIGESALHLGRCRLCSCVSGRPREVQS